MAQTRELIKTLKTALKAQGKTYADVAVEIGLTEASVKRLFSQQSFSLSRLDQVCHLLEIEISDLVQLMNEQQQRLQQLTIEQEKEITGDVTLTLVAVCVLNRWTTNEILSYYNISEPECVRHLAKLDRLKVIELLPRNRTNRLAGYRYLVVMLQPIQGRSAYTSTGGQPGDNQGVDTQCTQGNIQTGFEETAGPLLFYNGRRGEQSGITIHA